MKFTDITKIIDPTLLLKATMQAFSSSAIKDILAKLPITPEPEYRFNSKNPIETWKEGKLHWYPVGADRGNAGRIKLAGSPENPIGERIINAMEALIELACQKALIHTPNTLLPKSPRDAVRQFFGLPSLDQLPLDPKLMKGSRPTKEVTEIAERIKIALRQEGKGKDYTITVEDDGIGQTALRMHETLLSLGCSDKPDKPYLIGMFGQGGSSAFAASVYSWFISRRSVDLPDHKGGGIGWTVVCQIMPVGRRDVYWAYLAAGPDGQVPRLPESAADAVGFKGGTKIGHIGFKFASSNQAYGLYSSLNHLLFNPILPYYIVTRKDKESGKDKPDLMTGNAYRLTKLKRDKKDADKKFDDVSV